MREEHSKQKRSRNITKDISRKDRYGRLDQIHSVRSIRARISAAISPALSEITSATSQNNRQFYTKRGGNTPLFLCIYTKLIKDAFYK